MKQFYLGSDGKPCLWPIPDNCIWNTEMYKLESRINISLPVEFTADITLFCDQLKKDNNIEVDLKKEKTDIKVIKSSNEKFGIEGYRLDVTDDGISLEASTSAGTFYGCQTLLQLIANSPSTSIPGVTIIDSPANPLRTIPVRYPSKDQISEFKKIIDLLSKYKINRIAIQDYDRFNSTEEIPLGATPINKELKSLADYAISRHIELITDSNTISNSGILLQLDTIYPGQTAFGKITYSVLKASCIYWWAGLKKVENKNIYIMPEYLENSVAQLYPLERERISGFEYPSRTESCYKALDMSSIYNAPLYRLFGCNDDYDLMFLQESKNLSNTIPFYLFQGVLDFRFDNAMAFSGHRYELYANEIPVTLKARSLVFLHTYLMDRKKFNGSCCINTNREQDIVGYYAVNFEDGYIEKIKIIYGKTIFYWKTDLRPDSIAYSANPVFSGTTYGAPYIIYAQEWVNFRPDIEIKNIDIIPANDVGQDGIAVLGITAVL